MEILLNQLCACVDRQLHLYRDLLQLFHDERKAVLASDLDELNRVIVEKEVALQNIRREEMRRRQVADGLAAQLGLEAETLTITRLVEVMAQAPAAERLRHKGARLQTVIDEIQVESERNRSLCLHALQFVGNSIKMIQNLTRSNRVYHASGRIQGEGYIGRMLSGAV